MPMGCRSTRPRRSRARLRFSIEPDSALPKARASSTMRVACSKTSPLPLSPFPPSYSVLTATGPPDPSTRDDLSDDVSERERAGQAQHGPFADELRRVVHCLVHRHLGLLDDALSVFRAEIAEQSGARTVSRLLHVDHDQPSGGARGNDGVSLGSSRLPANLGTPDAGGQSPSSMGQPAA